MDTTQYQQQLDKVISETGNAAKTMTDTLNVTGKGLDKSIIWGNFFSRIISFFME